MIEPAQQAVAVELDLADPTIAVGRILRDSGELRRLALRQLSAHRALCRRFVAPAARVVRRGCLPFDRRRIGAFAFRFVVALDQQPVVLPAARTGTRLQSYQREPPVQSLTVQRETQFALAHPLFGIIQRMPRAAIPQFDCAAAVLAFRNGAFEVGIVQRMVLDMRSHPFVGGIERRPFAYRPAPQDAAMFQAEVPVQPGAMCLVLLHHEDRRSLLAASFGGCRFAGDREIALRTVGADRRIARGAAARHRSTLTRHGEQTRPFDRHAPGKLDGQPAQP